MSIRHHVVKGLAAVKTAGNALSRKAQTNAAAKLVEREFAALKTFGTGPVPAPSIGEPELKSARCRRRSEEAKSFAVPTGDDSFEHQKADETP